MPDETPEKTVLFKPRFKADVDARLREHISKRGELIKLIVLILRTVDLSTIPLLEIGDDLKDLAATTVKLPVALHATLKRAAENRRSSMNVLLNSAVWSYDEHRKDEQ